jgi:hypothetical protein
MNHLMFSLKAPPLLLLCLFFAHLAHAQQKSRFPIVDITTNALDWPEKTGSLALQITPLHWLGVRSGAAYRPQQQIFEQFIATSESFEVTGEARIFPFGPPRRAFQKDTRPAFWKKPKTGCNAKMCALLPVSKKTARFLQGLYIAPGFSFHRQDARYVPSDDLQSPIPEFQYRIVNQGPTLNAGYQIRYKALTLGFGGGLKFSRPRWQGTLPVFSDQIYSITFPAKLRVEQRFLLEIGCNF